MHFIKCLSTDLRYYSTEGLPVRKDGILPGHPVRRDKMRLTVMFDNAHFFKLRLEKQIYDSTITRSSMILPSGVENGLVFYKSNAVGYL